MTERDERAIAELVHRYSDGVTRRDLCSWTSCWAEDAVWSIRPGRREVGRDAIVAFLERAFAALEGVVQHVAHGAVRFEGDSVTGRWHIVEYYRRTGGAPAVLLAHYDDTYVEQDGHWRFASRRLVRHYEGPPDLTGTFTIGGH